MYYRFLDQFKTRPETLADLFDYADYVVVDSNIRLYRRSVEDLKRGGSNG